MRRILLPLGCVALAGASEAHDFWIRPSSFKPDAAARVEVDLRVGEGFRGERVARNPEKIARFVAWTGPEAEKPVAGVDGKAPAGFLRAAAPAWIVYESRWTAIELPRDEFEAYLREEGLERLIAQGGGTRERYRRCAKSLLGSTADEIARARVGLPVELVIEDGHALRLIADGRPVEGALVGLAEESKPREEVRLRTDAEGRVRFERCGPGVWLARAVHMVRAPEGSGADWESSWVSLTFEAAPAR